MKKSALAFLVCILISSAFLFNSCTGKPMPNGVVAFSCYDMKFDYFKVMEKGMHTRLTDLGYDLIVHDQKGRTDYQIQGCLDLLDEDIKALIISPINPKVLPKIVEKAHEKGIPVIIDDIGGGGSAYDAMVCPDDIEGGRIAAEYLEDFMQQKGEKEKLTALIVRNPPTITGAFSRGDGFREVATELGWMIYDISGEGEEETAYKETKKMLQEVPTIQAVFCTNDPMALGVVRACGELGREDVMIIGVNGDVQALKAIQNGKMLATVQLYPYAMGEIAADVADMLINGQTVEFDSEQERLILMPVRLIDRANVDEAFEAIH